jgi:4-diphosphocytidyl-2-C-methyl-D-erythritol kinase
MARPVSVERAPAKVNLTLVVRRRRVDGYHDLESLVVFARCGDELRFDPGGEGFRLVVRGRTAASAGPDADNLVLRAAKALAATAPVPGGTFSLVKRLPVAAGLGGGSSDAAAALRLLARAGDLSLRDERVLAAARATGSDVSVCLDPHARFMRGTGHELGAVLSLPRLPALLVNPAVAVSTPAVFRALGLEAGADQAGDPATALETGPQLGRAALLSLLAASRNDLEAPAVALAPEVATALAALRADPGCRFARMSGSGATVFGLFDTCRAAAAAGKAIAAVHPGWWVKPTMLG